MNKNLNIFLSAAGGGVIKVFFKNKLILKDFGYHFTIQNAFYSGRLFLSSYSHNPSPDEPESRSDHRDVPRGFGWWFGGR